MEIKVRFKNEVVEIDVDKGVGVRDVLLKAGINPETVIVRKDGEILMDEDKISNDCELEAISVVSGG